MKRRFFEFLIKLGLQLIELAVDKLGITWPELFLIKSDIKAIKKEVKQWQNRT